MDGRAKLGDRVTVKYFGTTRDGNSAGRNCGPKLLKFRVGGKAVISGVSVGVVGMAEGEKKFLKLAPEEAYGPVRDELFREIPRERIHRAVNLEVGKWLARVRCESERTRRVQIVEIKASTVVVDANHPLAGKFLEVEMHMISIQ